RGAGTKAAPLGLPPVVGRAPVGWLAGRPRRYGRRAMTETTPDERDELPEDLQPGASAGPYVFPNNNRRRIPAVLYAVIAAACVALWLVRRGDDPVLVNEGFLAVGVGLGLFAAYSWFAGYDLDVDERDALVAATKAVGFPVGHASAQLGWRGLRSRPTWRILLYSADEPPTRRGLVLVDGVDGRVLQHFVEDNPEDWTTLT
ncbi:MAG: hypothetical protein ACRD29_16300, partial [Acidimicrobiales bacterium]